MISSILYAIVGFIEVILGLRFVFRLIGANPGSSIVAWVYRWSEPFAAPFAGIFGQNTATGPGVVAGSVLDWTALIAMLVFALIAGIIGRLVRR